MSSSYVMILFLTFNFYQALASYQLFKLSEQWPPSVCRTNPRPCITNAVASFPYFTIHGLWPANFTRRLENCPSSTTFNLSLLNATLTAQLKKQWPNLLGLDQGFWSYEWNTHGTCSENEFDLANYFQLSINIKQRLDILGVLVAAGLGPKQNTKFNDTLLIGAIKARNGNFEPNLRCIRNNGQILLFEIVLCLTPDGINYISCPTGDPAVALCKNNLFEFPPN